MKKLIINHLEIIVIFLIVFFTSSYFAAIGVDPLHDGIIFKPALDVIEGKILFKETYNQYGVLSAFINALSLKVFGNYLLTIKLTVSFFYALTAVLIYLVWKNFLPKLQAFLSAFIYLLLAPYYLISFHPWPSVYSTFFLTLALFLFVTYLKKTRGSGVIFLLGITSSLSFLAKQPYAVLILTFISFFIAKFIFKLSDFKATYKNIVILLSGFSLILFIFLIWAISNDAFRDWWLQSIKIGYIGGRILGKEYNPLTTIGYLLPHPLWIILPFFCIFFLLKSTYSLLISKKRFKKDVEIFGLSLLCGSSFLQYFPLFDLNHTYWAATPAIGFFFYSINYIYSQIKSKRIQFSSSLRFILIIILSFSLILELSIRIPGAFEKVSKNYVLVKSPQVLKGIMVEKSEAEYYSEVSFYIDNYFKKYPKKTFVIIGSDALYMTFTDRAENMTPMYANYSGVTSGVYPYEPKLYEYIKENKPLILAHKFNPKTLNNYFKIIEWRDYKMTLLAPSK